MCLVEKCDQFLVEYLHKHPSSHLLDIIYKYNMSLNVKSYLDRIKKDFTIIYNENIERNIFLRLNANDLYELLLSKSHNSCNEYLFVLYIFMWLEYDVECRLEHAKLLLSVINVKLCSSKLLGNTKLFKTGNCILSEIFRQFNLKISICQNKTTLGLLNYYKVKSIDSFNIPFNEKSTRIATKKLSLYNIIRPNGGIYDFKNDQILFRYSFGNINRVIYINNYLIIINFTKGKMVRFNTITNDVIICSYPLDYLFDCRFPPTVNETIDGNLITIGGVYNDNCASKKVMIYNFRNDSWSDRKYLPYGVFEHATVIVDKDVYVIGGYANDSTRLTTLIRYRNGKWIELSPLSNLRSGHVALLRNNYIYVYGDNNFNLDAEFYNITTNKWTSFITDIFNGLTHNNSVCDQHVIYMHDSDDNSIYSLCLVNKTKTLLYDSPQIDVSANCLVLMNI